jgi:hypothetical protein
MSFSDSNSFSFMEKLFLENFERSDQPIKKIGNLKVIAIFYVFHVSTIFISKKD